MKSLAIDFGERRVGLAISDADGRLALPFGTIERDNDSELVRILTELAEVESIERFVIGEPRRLDGTRGPACRRVASFATKLQRSTGLPYLLVDESLTSRAAAERLREAGLDRRRIAAKIDETAAQILLEEALRRDLEAVSE